MSDKQRDEFIEQMTERYHEAVGNKEWEKLNQLGVEMEEAGLADLEVALSMTLTTEEMEEYRSWRKKNDYNDHDYESGDENDYLIK